VSSAGRLAPLLTAKLPPAVPVKSKPPPPTVFGRSAHAPPTRQHAPAGPPPPGASTGGVAECQAAMRRLQAENQRQAAEVRWLAYL